MDVSRKEECFERKRKTDEIDFSNIFRFQLLSNISFLVVISPSFRLMMKFLKQCAPFACLSLSSFLFSHDHLISPIFFLFFHFFPWKLCLSGRNGSDGGIFSYFRDRFVGRIALTMMI